MKKFLTIAMVALLAVTSVFAGFSGTFTGKATADFAGKSYTYGTSDSFKLTFDATTAESANEGDVYAKVAGAATVGDLKKTGSPVVSFKITEASLNGADWSVNLMGAAGVSTYANGVIARADANAAATPDLAASVGTSNGVTASYKGYTLGAGFNYTPATEAKYVKAGLFQENTTKHPAYYIKKTDGSFEKVVDEVTSNGADLYVLEDGKKASHEVSVAFGLPEYKFVEDKLAVTGSVGAYASAKDAIDLGFGAKVAYTDGFSVAAAFDGVLNITDDVKFNADAALSFAYAPVAVDVYYATQAAFMADPFTPVSTNQTGKNLLDVQVKTDLAAYEIPVSFTVAATDLVNDQRGLDASVAVAVAGANINVNGGYNFGSKAWNAGVAADYTLENVAKFAANVGLKGGEKLTDVSFGVSAENTTLINGAALKLAYASENFLNEEKAAGALTASIGLKF